jgi:pimeloyl-ACP methyl ester carboxylesterase
MEDSRMTAAQHGKPSIVFCHGIWADGSCFNRSKPSWYIVANQDRTVHPELERFVAKRMGATTRAIDSSHVTMLSHPDIVLEVIRAAAQAMRG